MYFSEMQNLSISCQNTVKLEIAVEIYKNFSVRSIKIHRPFLLQLSKLLQGHPTTVFCETSVRRSKKCLEFSIA